MFANWRALAPRLSEWLTAWRKAKGFTSFLLRFSPRYVLVNISQPKQGGHPGKTETIPVLTIEPVDAASPWMLDAPAAFETVRRLLEFWRGSQEASR